MKDPVSERDPSFASPAFGVRRLPPRAAFIRRYGVVLGRQIWLIALIVACALVGAAAITASQSTVYRASMKVVVGQGNGFFQPQFGSSVQPFTQTMTALLESDVVATEVIKKLNLPATPRSVLSQMSVASNPESSVLDVSYDSTSKQTAVSVLNTIGSTFAALVKQRFGSHPTANGGPAITATVFDPAHLQPSPVRPRPTRNLALAGVLGLLLGLTAAFLRESIDERVRTREEVEAWLAAPVVGVLPQMPAARPWVPVAKRRYIARLMIEALHMLRANLEFSTVGTAGKVIVVTSAAPEEGKTTLAAALSVVLARSGKDVICVDADLRRPRLAEYLGREESTRGLIEVLTGDAELEDVLRDVSPPYFGRKGVLPPLGNSLTSEWLRRSSPLPRGQLRLISHGSISDRASEIMLTADLDALTKELSALADYVIIDTPPILVAADAYPIIRAADTVLVTVREGLTKRSAVEQAADTFDVLGIAGRLAVLNGAAAGSSYSYYGYLQPSAPRERRRFGVVDRTTPPAEKDSASESAS